MYVLIKNSIPKDATSYGMIYKGCGDPKVEHDLVGITFYGKSGNAIITHGKRERDIEIGKTEDFTK